MSFFAGALHERASDGGRVTAPRDHKLDRGELGKAVKHNLGISYRAAREERNAEAGCDRIEERIHARHSSHLSGRHARAAIHLHRAGKPLR